MDTVCMRPLEVAATGSVHGTFQSRISIVFTRFREKRILLLPKKSKFGLMQVGYHRASPRSYGLSYFTYLTYFTYYTCYTYFFLFYLSYFFTYHT